MRNFNTTKYRVVLSGNILEFYEFEKPLFYGYTEPKRAREIDTTEDVKEENRIRSKRRSHRMVKRLVHANFGMWYDALGKPYVSKFLTLTFKNEVLEVDKANEEFTLFIKRLNYAIFNSKTAVIQYLAIIEFQPNSKRVHYHVILFNLPYIPRYIDIFNEAWGQGYLWIKKITNEQHAANYITKYMTKEDDIRLRGEKSYFNSRGIKRPIVIREHFTAFGIKNLLPQAPLYQRTFENEYTGKTNYSCYDIKNHDNVKSVIRAFGKKQS